MIPSRTPITIAQQSTSNSGTPPSSGKAKSKSKLSSKKQTSKRLYTKAIRPSPSPAQSKRPGGHHPKTGESLTDSLAICLVGYTSHRMYDSEYEEEVRKQAVMQEVLPDATMWKKWEATEAPLRQGRGWYPTLDRHFLELLVISEIHCLSHPLPGQYPSASAGANAERIHRHASRVRRVACERIGAERLHAYCDRVKEAFDAYVQGGWGGSGYGMKEDDAVSDEDGEANAEGDGLGLDDEERGRGLEREGSAAKRRDIGPSPPHPSPTQTQTQTKDDGMVVEVSSPLDSPSPSLCHSLSDSDSGEDIDDADNDGMGDLLKIDLEGVIEVEENEADNDADGKVYLAQGKTPAGMNVDVQLGGQQVPQIHIVTPSL